MYAYVAVFIKLKLLEKKEFQNIINIKTIAITINDMEEEKKVGSAYINVSDYEAKEWNDIALNR